LPDSGVQVRLESHSWPIVLEKVAATMGRKAPVSELFYEFSVARRVPDGHLLRRIESVVAVTCVRALTGPFYLHTGQPSVDPVVLVKPALLGYLYGLPSEGSAGPSDNRRLVGCW